MKDAEIVGDAEIVEDAATVEDDLKVAAAMPQHQEVMADSESCPSVCGT